MEDEIQHVRDLVFLRDLFARNGATEEELREFDEAIGSARARLADAARAAAAPLAA